MVNGFDRARMVNISQSDADRARLGAVGDQDLRDDGTDYEGVVVQKPWGSEWQGFRNAEFSAWQLNINAGAETSMHCHPGKTTILVVTEGEVVVSTLESSFWMSVGQVLIIERGVFHRTASSALAGAVVMELESPANKRDLVRIEDRYGRAGMGYECA